MTGRFLCRLGVMKMMSPIVDEIVEEESEIKSGVQYYHCRSGNGDCTEIQSTSIPTFIAFKNGEEAGRQSVQYQKGELLSLIK